MSVLVVITTAKLIFNVIILLVTTTVHVGVLLVLEEMKLTIKFVTVSKI